MAPRRGPGYLASIVIIETNAIRIGSLVAPNVGPITAEITIHPV